ncbi:cupredoxin domain-containing protein [Mycoplana dimorpha]|uniref:Plastocyanin n=1 Tax=Mycoplana dimorpha TaxID=28320 RepID=A0A2T5AZE6_MYCDI|nr:cupredoxin family copper-binding protein [Mycoplana dimorpha]PTM92113.1 plastocyanin [Mycoplana dimorpha]
MAASFLRSGLAAGAIVALVAVCASAAAAAEVQITIAKMKFSPASTQAKVGDVVVWKNDDIFRHSATARDKSFDVDLPPNSEKRMTITQAGSVDYYCRFHPAMVGKLEIAP